MATNSITEIFNTPTIVDLIEAENGEMKKQTLKERIGVHKINLTNYEKHDGTTGRKTGEALLTNKIYNLCIVDLLTNKIYNLCIVDIDINKSYDDERKEKIRSELLEELDINDVVVKTASGGLHIYCNQDFFTLTSNRMIKCFTSEDFDVDIFGCHDQNKRSIVVMPPSKVRANHNSSVSKYTFIRGSFESCITRSINEVLKL